MSSKKKDVEKDNLTSAIMSPFRRCVRRSSCENGDTVIDQPLCFGTEEESSFLKSSHSRCPPATDKLCSDGNLSGRWGLNGRHSWPGRWLHHQLEWCC